MGNVDLVPGSPSLILIEPDDRTAALVLAGLEAHFSSRCVERLSGIHEVSGLAWGRVHLAICGMDWPSGEGLSVLEHLLSRREDLPVLLMVSESRIEHALHGIACGACDYVIKADDLGRTVARAVQKNLALWVRQQGAENRLRRVKRSLSAARDRNRELEEAVVRLQAMAGTDPLTGLANRRVFARDLDQAFAEAQRYEGQLACMMIDLDGFKQLNDTLGHPAGDRILERAARVLEANCRRSDVAARFGGDEFIVLLPRTDEGEARRVAMRIQREFAQLSRAALANEAKHEIADTNEVFGDDRGSGGDLRISMSMGLACWPLARSATAEQLVAAADHALYRAKQTGKTRLVVYERHGRRDSKSPRREKTEGGIGV